MDIPSESKDSLPGCEDENDIVTFIIEYIRSHYEAGGSNITLSAREVRYAVLESGLSIDHAEAISLVERLNAQVLDEQTARQSRFIGDYLYRMNHSEARGSSVVVSEAVATEMALQTASTFHRYLHK